MYGIRSHKENARAEHLGRLKNQGKTWKCYSADPVSGHFLQEGRYTRFADWRFVHKARLNLVPLRSNQRWKAGPKQCRRCNHPLETLPHVLQHCMTNSATMQRRHNSVLDRIKTAATGKGYAVIAENQQVLPNVRLRPDLVITKDNVAHIIDVTIPFDEPVAFDQAREAKIRKYDIIKQHLGNQYTTVTVEPILVGALGSWDKKNNQFVRQLGSRRYIKTMKRLCVSDVLKWSRDIYVEHLTGQRQYQ